MIDERALWVNPFQIYFPTVAWSRCIEISSRGGGSVESMATRKTLLSIGLLLALGGVSAAHATDRALNCRRNGSACRPPPPGSRAGVVFPFSETLHTVHLRPVAPVRHSSCSSEKVNNVKIGGDKVRWKIEGALSRPGRGGTVHLVVKPTQAGLTTSWS